MERPLSSPHHQHFNSFIAHRPNLQFFLHSKKSQYAVCILTTEKSDKAIGIQESWQKCLADPSQYWESNFNKEVEDPRIGSLVHNITKQKSWVDSCGNRQQEEGTIAIKLYQPHIDAVVRADFVRDSYEAPSWELFSKLRYEGPLNEALQAMDILEREGPLVSTDIYSHLLQRCIKEKNLVVGWEVFYFIVRSGLESDPFLGSFLIRLFTSVESLSEASQVFNKLCKPTVYSWSAIISAHVKFQQYDQAILLYQQMIKSDVKPDGHTFVTVLKACSSIGSLEHGKCIHAHIVQRGLDLDQFVGSVLIEMYCKYGCLDEAQVVFDRLRDRDVVTWSTLIAGYVQHGYGHNAFQLFEHMQWEGMKPDTITFVGVLQACSSTAALEHGKQIHNHVVEIGFEFDRFVGGSLVDMYAKCGNIDEARNVFNRMPQRDLVSWSALIAGYAQHGHGQGALQHGWEALQLFHQMLQEGMESDKVTYVCVLQACSSIQALEEGKQIHTRIIESGFELDLFVGNTLIDMYAKCESIDIAQTIFHRLPKTDVVTWSALIAGYAQHGHGQAALQLFRLMQQKGMGPNQVTFVCILQACASSAALEHGRQIHKYIIESGLESDLFVANTLIDMYAKCGSIDEAHTIFNRLPMWDTVTWSALISGYALRGDYMSAIHCFEDMQKAGWKPNGVTYLNLLSACSHVKYVDEGCLQFKQMREDCTNAPTLEHYTALVDLLARAGFLNEAEDLLESLPFQPNIVGWTSLLGSCRTHGNVEIGRRSFDRAVMMHGRCAAAYVLMSGVYVYAGLREEAEKMDELRRCANVWKKPAMAFIEIDNEVYDFIVGDNTHPRTDDIYAKLKELSAQMRLEGYVQNLDLDLDSAANHDKEDALCGHSERLAIAFGLICTPQGTTIRVAKNLRVCTDCHNAVKLISRIELREIIITDAYCIHHFKDGVCCCND